MKIIKLKTGLVKRDINLTQAGDFERKKLLSVVARKYLVLNTESPVTALSIKLLNFLHGFRFYFIPCYSRMPQKANLILANSRFYTLFFTDFSTYSFRVSHVFNESALHHIPIFCLFIRFDFSLLRLQYDEAFQYFFRWKSLIVVVVVDQFYSKSASPDL